MPAQARPNRDGRILLERSPHRKRGAKMLDLDSRIGSLEVGKDADFIVLSGDPLSTYTHVLQTYLEGKKVFDRSDPKDFVFAVGGKGATDEGDMNSDIHCFDGDNGGGN